MKLFTFSQCDFDCTDKNAVKHAVIKAKNAGQAVLKAEEMGFCFDNSAKLKINIQ